MGILDDKRPIRALYTTEGDGYSYCVNLGGVDKIEAYGAGPHCEIPWFAIWVDGLIKYRVPAAGLVVEYADEEQAQVETTAPAEFEPSPTDAEEEIY